MALPDEHKKAAVAAVPCPYCLADKGVPCKKRTMAWNRGRSHPHRYGYVHGARMDAYAALVAPEG